MQATASAEFRLRPFPAKPQFPNPKSQVAQEFFVFKVHWYLTPMMTLMMMRLSSIFRESSGAEKERLGTRSSIAMESKRIYYLAEKMDLDPSIVLEIARSSGLDVKNRLGRIEEDEAEKIEKEWQRQLADNKVLSSLFAALNAEKKTSDELRQDLRNSHAQIEELTRRLQGTPGPFFATRRRSPSGRKKLFHREGCEWAKTFIGTAACLTFSNHEEAVRAGFRPCKTCCS